jgi:signal transduction histidine kinase
MDTRHRGNGSVTEAAATFPAMPAGSEPFEAEAIALRGQVAGLRLDLAAAALLAGELRAAAAGAQQRQMAFLATVAHELRNPLMPLRLAAQMLDRARGDAAKHAGLQETIKGQVAQMTRLIGDLLDGSRITTGQLRLERTQVDLAEVVGRAVETCQPVMEARGHSFHCVMPAGPLMLLGDVVRLVQVFGNLLENAAKYTPEGGAITLEASVQGPAVAVSVRDNGIGITAAALPHVFDLFARDLHAAEINHGGLGIGLSVVRELVNAHEGSVRAASHGKGLGSEFVVRLPLAATQLAAPAVSS